MKWMIAIFAAGLISGGSYYWYSHKTTGLSYEPYKVQKGTVEIKILSTGTVQPQNRLEIKPPIAGRMEKILVDEGYKVRKGQILAWMSSTERAAMLDAARAQGSEEVARWEDMYKPTPIISPINGTVIVRNVESGQTFTSADAILVLSDKLTVKALVDETDMARVQIKQKATIQLDAYSKEPIPAYVDQIAFEAKTTNNVTTYQVDVVPIQTPEFMRSGMTANVTFLIDSRENALVLPTDLVTLKEQKASVLIPNPNDAKAPLSKEIEVGLNDGKQIEILSGLQEGDTILSTVMENSDGKPKNSSPFGMPKANGRRKK